MREEKNLLILGYKNGELEIINTRTMEVVDN